MKETLEQKKRRLFGKQYLNEYTLIVKKITANIQDLCIKSILETDKIIDIISNLNLKETFVIPFGDKEKLQTIIIERLKLQGTIYLFTSLSKDCGAIEIPSINNFNFNFDFSDDKSGIISLINSDLKRKILLDFYENENNKFIEIEYYE